MEDHPAVQAVKAKEEAGSEPAAWPMYVAPEVSGLHEKQQVFQYHAQQAQRALAAYEALALQLEPGVRQERLRSLQQAQQAHQLPQPQHAVAVAQVQPHAVAVAQPAAAVPVQPQAPPVAPFAGPQPDPAVTSQPMAVGRPL